MAIFRGTAGDDNLSGTSGDDTFLLWQGGNDTVDAGDGNDIFRMGGALNAGDKLDGGAGKDSVILSGDYSAGLVFNADTITNIEVMGLAGGHSYNLALDDGNVAAGARLLVKAGGLGAGDHLTFDGSAETDGKYTIIAGAGDDTLTGGAKHDVFDLSHGGNDTVHGGGGYDTFVLGAAFTAADSIDGGTGIDTVTLDGNYSPGPGFTPIIFGATTITNVENLVLLGSGNFYHLITNDGNVAAGQTLTVDASAAGQLWFEGDAETDGSFHIISSTNDQADTVSGGQQADTIDVQSGSVGFYRGNGGNDVFNIGNVTQANIDISGDAGDDVINVNGTVSKGILLGGGIGNDTFNFLGNFNSDVSLNGATNFDTLVLNGDYTGGVTLSSTKILALEKLTLLDGHSYDLTVTGDLTSAHGQFIVDASAIATGSMTLDLSGATSGSYSVTGGAGDDTVTFGTNYSTADTVNGGAGTDTFDLTGGGDILLGSGLTNFEILKVANVGMTITSNDANVASGATLIVDATAETSAHFFGFYGSAETDGNFVFKFSDGFTAFDQINGGAGDDTVELHGDYSGGLTLGAFTLESVETIKLDAGFSYGLTMSDGNVASGATLALDASALAAGQALALDASAETDGFFAITGGAGDDSITFAGNLTAADSIDGGAGYDVLLLNGDYSGGLSLAAITNVEEIDLGGGHSYNFTASDGNVAAGQTLTVSAAALGATDTLTFDGSAETDGYFAITGGAGDDTVTIGSPTVMNGTTFDGGAGNDTLVFDGAFSNYTLEANALTNVETLKFIGTFSSEVSTVDSNVAAGDTLTVDFSALPSASHFVFFGADETDGNFHFIAGGAGSAAQVQLTGGGGNDVFDLTASTFLVGSFFHGGNGDDTFQFSGNFGDIAPTNPIQGGGGNDTLSLNGDYSTLTSITASEVSSIETLQLLGGSNHYNLTVGDGITSTLTVDASAAASLNLDAGAAATTAFIFTGSASDDVIYGGGLADTFNMSGGGSDTVQGNGGNDTFYFGNTFNGADAVDGGSGSDTLEFGMASDFAQITVSDTRVTHLETLVMDSTGQQDEVFITGDITGGGSSTLSLVSNETQVFMIDLTQATTPFFNYTENGTGRVSLMFADNFSTADHLTATAHAFPFLSSGVSLDGDYTGGNKLVFTDNTMVNFGGLQLEGGSYDITFTDATVSGSGLDVEATTLTSSQAVTLDDTAETSSTLYFDGGDGNDVVKAGAGSGIIYGFGGDDHLSGNGSDLFNGGAGADTITIHTASSIGVTVEYKVVSDSTAGTGATAPVIDTVSGVDFDNVFFAVQDAMGGNVVGAIDAARTGFLNSTTVGDSLSTDIGSNLGAYDALLFTSTGAGSYEQNHVFLVVDCNGTAGYQAGADLVIDVTGFTGTLTTGVFYAH
jgi:hypothetical protein